MKIVNVLRSRKRKKENKSKSRSSKRLFLILFQKLFTNNVSLMKNIMIQIMMNVQRKRMSVVLISKEKDRLNCISKKLKEEIQLSMLKR